jgi:hypothetical protein
MSKMSDLAQWFGAQHVEAVGLSGLEGGSKYQQFIARFPAESMHRGFPHPMTGKQRMSNFLSLKLRYPLGSDGYSCLAMAAGADGAAPAHYAFVYWRRGCAATEPPEYICVSPTFESRDGEYRRRFIRYPVFMAAYEEQASAFAPFEDAVLAMLARGSLRLTSAAYPHADADRLTQWATDARAQIITFTVAIALDLWEVNQGLMMVHTSQPYVTLMQALAAAHPALAATSLRHTASLTIFHRGERDATRVQCGQKLVPMVMREMMQPFDYNFAVWRELAVTKLVGDLVINMVAPGFSIYNQWAHVEDADARLFENAAMAERYARGAAAASAVDALRLARQRTLAAGKTYHTEMLSGHIYESLEYAQSYLVMSAVAMLHTMEDVGFTLRSLGSYVRRAKVQWPVLTEAFANIDNAGRTLFEWTYSAHCLHTKLGVAHTDLHGNNLTVYRWGLADLTPSTTIGGAGVPGAGELPPDPAAVRRDQAKPFYDDPIIGYVAGPRGEADTYVFPATGTTGCLIDFSRAILGPAFRPRLGEGRTPQYATNFYRDQVNRAMRVFHRYAPDYVGRHQDAIKAAVLADFDAAFPVLCAVDFMAIGASVADTLTEELPIADPLAMRPFHVAREAITLAQKLEAAGREQFILGLHRLTRPAGAVAADAKAHEGADASPFPGGRVIAQVFGEWLFTPWAAREPKRIKTAQFVDAYNYNNELRFSGDNYSEFPPWAKFDELERHLGEYKLSQVFERGVEPFLTTLQTGERLEVMAEQTRTEQERLDGKPVAAASSWIED